MKALFYSKVNLDQIFQSLRKSCCNKILLAKLCLAKFEKRLNMLYEQLSKSKCNSYKNKFTTIALLKKIKLYVLWFGRWAIIMQQTVLTNEWCQNHAAIIFKPRVANHFILESY
jgi:hypothetical protein